MSNHISKRRKARRLQKAAAKAGVQIELIKLKKWQGV